jgi:60 kDa SS-A/Ro ribonucleoprotein
MSLSTLKNAGSAKTVSQDVSLKVRKDQVKNDDGVYVFSIDSMSRIHRFLISGVSSNFYRPATQLSQEMIDTLNSLTPEQELQAVKMACDISSQGRASKNEYAIYTIAYLMCKGHEDTRKACEAAVGVVCRTGTHILQLADCIKSIGGWSKLRRRAVASWYLSKPVDKLTYQLVKYANRGGWTHRDVMRQIHLKSEGERAQVINYAVNAGRTDEGGNDKYTHKAGNKLLDAVIAIKSASTLESVLKLIIENELPHEVVPSDYKNNPCVQYALLQNMPYMAMVRNLASYSKSGLLADSKSVTLPANVAQLLDVRNSADMSDKAEKHVLATIADNDKLRKSRIHPMHLLLALSTYESGHGVNSNSTWSVNGRIVRALNAAFLASIKMQDKLDKSVLVGLDVSPSMQSARVLDTHITAAMASAAFSLSLDGAFERVEYGKFASRGFEQLTIKSSSVIDVTREFSQADWDGTNLCLPIEYAIEQFHKTGRVYDSIIIMTDNDTNSGGHVYQRMNFYRNLTKTACRFVVLAFSASNFTVADPNDALSMDFPGLDADLVSTAQKFISGEL